MSRIATQLRTAVVQRAASRCEYCQLAQAGQEATFHIDHVVPVAAEGATTLENLALACVSCSLRKAARTTVADPATGEALPIFNPRRQRWVEHFRWNAGRIEPLSAIGRATVSALEMNRALAVAIRIEETLRGRQPQ